MKVLTNWFPILFLMHILFVGLWKSTKIGKTRKRYERISWTCTDGKGKVLGAGTIGSVITAIWHLKTPTCWISTYWSTQQRMLMWSGCSNMPSLTMRLSCMDLLLTLYRWSLLVLFARCSSPTPKCLYIMQESMGHPSTSFCGKDHSSVTSVAKLFTLMSDSRDTFSVMGMNPQSRCSVMYATNVSWITLLCPAILRFIVTRNITLVLCAMKALIIPMQWSHMW